MEYELLLVNAMRNYDKVPYGFQDCIGQHLIAEYLRTKDFSAKVLSADVKRAFPIIKGEIIERNVPIIGFYIAADNTVPTQNIIRRLKTEFQNIIIVVGGPQAIALNKEFFLNYNLDYAIVGEGEIPMLKLLSFLIDGIGEVKDIPSLVYLNDNGELVKNSTTGAIIENLDSIPFPKYCNSLNKTFRKGKMVGIITGRGCPFNCAFCYEGSNTKNVRLRSISNVMEEIDYIIENNPELRFLNVYDDTFTLHRSRLHDFCKEIERRNLKWFCEGHGYYLANNLDVIGEMVKSGLVSMQLGIESGSELVLDSYNKKTKPEDIINVVAELKRSGITSVSGNLIIGGALESQETLKQTKAFTQKLLDVGRGIIELSLVFFAPYPNTDMVINSDKYDIVLNPDIESHIITSMKTPVISTSSMSCEDIRTAKKDFDDFLRAEYISQAYKITKAELIQGLFCCGKREFLNPTWEKAYGSIEHIHTFLDHLTDEEQDFSLNKYPIRCFEEFTLNGDLIVSDAGSFDSVESSFLLNANGRNTALEIAELIGISHSQVAELYSILNKRCLVYMSEF